MIVVDTTILVYAVGGEHPFRDPCRALLAAVEGNRVAGHTTPEVIQEFVHVASRRRPRAEAANLGRDFATGLGPLLVTGSLDLEEGLSIYETHPGLGAFDSVLAAVAIRAGAEALVSGDGGFAMIPGLNHVSPGSPAFPALLR